MDGIDYLTSSDDDAGKTGQLGVSEPVRISKHLFWTALRTSLVAISCSFPRRSRCLQSLTTRRLSSRLYMPHLKQTIPSAERIT